MDKILGTVLVQEVNYIPCSMLLHLTVPKTNKKQPGFIQENILIGQRTQ